MTAGQGRPDWIVYVPRRVHDAARRLEAASERCGYPSLTGVAEHRMYFRPTPAARAFWNQVWRYMMEEDCVPPGYNIKFVVVDDPAFERLHSVRPEELI